MTNGVGAGVVIKDNGEYHRYRTNLPMHCTVFQAEVQALQEAANYLKTNQVKNRKIMVFSDSQAALMALNNAKIRSKQMMDTALNWTEVSKVNVAELNWVRAHVGTDGNEEADRLAKEGTGFAIQTFVAPSRNYIRKKIMAFYDTKWDGRWTTADAYHPTRSWIRKRTQKNLLSIRKLCRPKLFALVSFITGHGKLGAHQNKIDPRLDPRCRICERGKETPYHLARECEVLEVRSYHMIGLTAESWTAKGLLEFMALPEMSGLGA
jgi:ribonuclease HI